MDPGLRTGPVERRARGEVSRPVVIAVDEQDEPVDIERWTALARRSLEHEGIERGELNLLFVTSAAMAELNREHLGHEGPTDVLSFPLDAGDDSEAVAGVGEVLLGDVVICPEQAALQAPGNRSAGEHDGSFEDEIALLVVHGVLHVLGHDHAELAETESMRARERVLLDAYHRS
jgi:probable rRNA maturation factor